MRSLSSVVAAVTLLSSLCHISPATLAAVLDGPIANPASGHLYYLLNADTWWDSQTAAKRLGGNLVTINDQAENDWVVDTFGLGRNLWIGLYQVPGSAEPGGGWRWISGETSSYTNWDVIEPNDGFGNEDYVQIWGNADDIAAGPSYAISANGMILRATASATQVGTDLSTSRLALWRWFPKSHP